MRDDDKLTWRNAMRPYETPVLWKSLWQTVNTLVPFAAMWYLMYLSLETSYAVTLGIACVAAGFLIRIFVILHDCGHGSFFKSQKANNFLGSILGVLTFTPYHYWRYEHAVHHATSGDLDRRSVGDIWTLTVDEYRNAPRWKRVTYRCYRNPLALFIVGPVLLFLIGYRIPLSNANRRERRSVYRTSLAVFGLAALISSVIGIKAYLLIQLPMLMIACSAGVWMFYIQHQFEGVYWERHENWDYLTAALEGSSFYTLPTVLRWFTGNIGYHHIHHLGPRVPNYFLKDCYDETPLFQNIKPITLWTSLKALSLHLWDEQRRELVGWGHLKSM